MLANTLYLLANRIGRTLPEPVAGFFAYNEETIPKLFQVMVLSHTGLGALVTIALALFAVRHLPSVWRRHRPRTVVTGILFVSAGLVLAVTGPFIVYAAASREHMWVWWTHVCAAAVVPLAYILHRSVSYVRPASGSYKRFGAVVCTALVVVLAGHAFSNRGLQLTHEARIARSKGTFNGPGSKLADRAEFIADSHESAAVRGSGLVPASFVPPGSPFFPSAATTTTGDYLPERIITRGDTSAPEKLVPDLDWHGFVVQERIGADTCARCHPDIVEQWAASAHRFASFNNPFYEATINLLRESSYSSTRGVAKHVEAFPHWRGREGKIKSKWCSGCHDPSVMLAGRMTEEIDRRSPQAQAGLTCLACHAIDRIHNNTGNGNYNIADEQEDPYLFAKAESGTLAALLHDTAIKAKPDAHKRQMLKPFFRTSEFCATCHKVSLDEPVNNYRWFRGQNEYDAWHDSGVALNAARTFYLPPDKRVCQDCHMPFVEAPLGDVSARDGKVRSHRFLAVNTALPFVRGDQETVRQIEAFLRDEKLRVDVFALVRAGEDGQPATAYALERTRPTLRPGETVTLDVVVRNQGVGHTFPGGTNDSNEAWIELTVLDDDGRVLYQSGFVRDDGYVDPAAQFFRAVLVDRHSQRISKRNAQDIYAPVYVSVIGPGTAQTVHYRLAVPEAPLERITLRARLMWRKFDREYTEFAYHANPEGFRAFDDVPDLPITEICRDEVVLAVASSQDERVGGSGDGLTGADWERFNDYGIGLLLQGDTRGAQKAFAEVERLAPERLDGPRNLARAAIQEGDLGAAYDYLLRCEELVSNDPQTAYFWGVVLQEDGRYVEAASAYLRVLQRFPDDRATWRNLGRTYYLDGKFDRAIEAFGEVLRIDPEDRVAWYHLLLCHRASGNEAEARRAEAAYMRYKIDESRDAVTQAYRLSHPHDNRLSQPIHIHDLAAPAERMAGAAEPGVTKPTEEAS
jgi:tetratricopeptide (TPR) repeat protein